MRGGSARIRRTKLRCTPVTSDTRTSDGTPAAGRDRASHARAVCTKRLRSRLSASGLVTPSSRNSSTSGSAADMAARARTALPARATDPSPRVQAQHDAVGLHNHLLLLWHIYLL